MPTPLLFCVQNLLTHGAKCAIKVQGGCNVCRRIWALLQIHARQCRKANCQVPKCRQLKEQLINEQDNNTIHIYIYIYT